MRTETKASRNGATPQSAASLSRDALRGRLGKPPPIITIPVPELAEPGEVAPFLAIQRLSGGRRRELVLRELRDREWDDKERERRESEDGWEGHIRRNEVNKHALILMSVVEPEGGLALSDDDIDLLAEENPPAFDWIYAAAVVFNGLPQTAIATHLLRRAEDLGIAGPAVQIPIGERLGNLLGGPGSSSS